MAAKRATREVWARRVQDWLDSGLTCAQYAAKTGLNEHTLGNWRGKLRRAANPGSSVSRGVADARKSIAEAETAQFVELSAVAAPDTRVELELPNGCRLRFALGFDAVALGSLVDVLLREVQS